MDFNCKLIYCRMIMSCKLIPSALSYLHGLQRNKMSIIILFSLIYSQTMVKQSLCLDNDDSTIETSDSISFWNIVTRNVMCFIRLACVQPREGEGKGQKSFPRGKRGEIISSRAPYSLLALRTSEWFLPFSLSFPCLPHRLHHDR